MAQRAPAKLDIRHPESIRVDDDVELRILRPEHAEEMFRLVDRDRAHLRRWLPWVDGTRSADHIRAFIERSGEQLQVNNGFQAGIWYRGKLVGVIGYHYWDWQSRKTELGYWLSEDAEGKGIMTRACQGFIDYALGKLRLNRVEIRAAAGNARSRAIPERLGFVREGVLREGDWTLDHFEDQFVYGLLRKDWAERRGQGSL